MTARQIAKLDPNLALRSGTTDAATLLSLWCARKTFFPLIWLGFIVAFARYGDLDSLEADIEGLNDPSAAFAALLSPLGGLVLALGIRLVANWLALLAAFPLTSWTRTHEYTSGWRFNRWLRSWWDRIYLARAYRSLRWTGVVREAAYARLGERGRFFRVCELTIGWANIVFFISMFAAVAITQGS